MRKFILLVKLCGYRDFTLKLYRKMVINGAEYLSLKSRSSRSAAIVAKWLGNGGINEDGNVPRRVGSIKFFLS